MSAVLNQFSLQQWKDFKIYGNTRKSRLEIQCGSAEKADIIISQFANGQLNKIGCSDDGQTFAKKRNDEEAKELVEVWIDFYKHKQDGLW